MAAKIVIMDGANGTGQYAGVTPIGELIVAGFGTLKNQAIFQAMAATNTSFNFFGPISGQQFVITSITLDGPAGATISIYEAANPSTIAIDKLLYKINLRAAGNLIVPFSFGGFLAVSEGEYVNAFTDTATTNMTIIGYYSPTIHNVI
jgi:hypothetical protein